MSDCFHCGLPVPAGADWIVKVDDVPRAMCCPGCAAAAEAIVAHGLTSYYRDRTAMPERVDADALIPPELRLVDREENLRQVLDDSSSDDRCSASLSVEGLRCAACSWLIEGRLARLPGVQGAQMNVGAGRLKVAWDPEQIKLSDILLAIRGIGYQAYPNDARRQGAALQKAAKQLARRAFVAGLSMMQVMMYAWPAYVADDGTLDADSATLMRWASLILTLPAILYSAQPFFAGAWRALRNWHADMDLPVALGLLAAFAGSTVATVRGVGDVYFDSVSMFVFLLLCSRYLELQARRRAVDGLERLQQGMPQAATRIPGYPATREAEVVSPADLVAGDVVLVKPGEAFPCDGVIIEGESAVDLSLLTGESKPQPAGPGTAVPGGAVNTRQLAYLRVAREAQDSTLSRLLLLAGQAGMGKPRLAQWADKVGAWFVPALLLVAAGAFFLWYGKDPAYAWEVAVAVLVVSCPCALSLATPTALAAATDRLLRDGVLVTQGHAIETLHRATHVVFDKTGTLTQGRPGVRATSVFGARSVEDCLRIAAALEAGSAHPLAQALLAAAPADGRPTATDLHTVQGQGVEGLLDGQRWRLGTADFVGALAGGSPPAGPQDSDATPVYLGNAEGWLACFALADALRGEAADVVAQCQAAGKTVVILSGDHPDAVAHLARRLSIEQAHGGFLPEQKLAYVRELQGRGAVVAMVGDGINDAAVLSAADVSFAMGSGAALAQVHADAILLGNLDAFGRALHMAARTLRVIKQNLAWATVYNIVAIPAAAFGFIGPLLSGIGMSTSSMAVVANAWRLRRRTQG